MSKNEEWVLVIASSRARSGCHVGAVLDEEPGHIHMTPFGRPMQRGRCPFLALGCRVSTVLDEEPGHIHMTPEGRLMQRSHRPTLALGCCVNTVLDEKPGCIHMTPEGKGRAAVRRLLRRLL